MCRYHVYPHAPWICLSGGHHGLVQPLCSGLGDLNYPGPFCLSALEQALDLSKPEIFNTDQGSQFTSLEFTDRLEQGAIRISMDSRGRVYDNIFVERLWRSVKYEEVYLHQYQTVSEARNGMAKYFLFYNLERLHESLGYQTPYEIYVKDRAKINIVRASTMHHIQPYFLS